jgi:glycosyltransferase involved in cell wall biosynthesis
MSPDRVKVIPNALNYPYLARTKDFAWQRLRSRWPAESSRPEWLTPATGGFLLNVGGGQWYKNRPGLLKIYAALTHDLSPPAPKLVMVGKPLSQADERLAQTLGIAQEITLLTDVSNEDLEALYCAAEGLLFPSLNEGFGWPIAEAQACGCPVFTSNRPPMTEVGGESALYFDPESPEDAAKKIAAGWDSRPLRVKHGLQEANRWSIDLMLDAYEALYREAAVNPRGQDQHRSIRA